MSGVAGRSGRRLSGGIKLRIRLSLDPTHDLDLIQFFGSVPTYCRGEALKAALRGGLTQGRQIVAENEARVEQLAAQERAEINTGLAGLGNEWDE